MHQQMHAISDLISKPECLARIDDTRGGDLQGALDIALGSQAEVEVQLEIANRVGLLADREYKPLQSQVEKVGRMLNALIASMRTEGDSTEQA